MTRVKEIQDDDPLLLAHQTVLDNFFYGTPYSLSVYGTEASLKAIRKKDVDKFYEDYFRAGQMILVVSSDRSQLEIEEILERHFGGIPSGSDGEQVSPVTTRIPDKNSHFIEKDTQQTLVMAAYPMPRMCSLKRSLIELVLPLPQNR